MVRATPGAAKRNDTSVIGTRERAFKEMDPNQSLSPDAESGNS